MDLYTFDYSELFGCHIHLAKVQIMLSLSLSSVSGVSIWWQYDFSFFLLSGERSSKDEEYKKNWEDPKKLGDACGGQIFVTSEWTSQITCQST